MKKNILRILSVLTAVCLLTVSSSVALAASSVTVELDGEKVVFSEAAPYYDEAAGRIYVPVRAICEAMGATVDYEASSKTVTITRGGTTLKLRIGVKTATVNGVAVALDAPPFIESSSTFVPLRFVSENLQLDVEWNASSKKVTLTSRAGLSLGMSSADVRSSLGDPDRTDISEKGYVWWVYDDLSDYRMIGISDDKVVAYYLHSASWQTDSGLRSGMTAADCDALLSQDYVEQHTTYTCYSGSGVARTLMYDDSGAAYAVLEELEEYGSKTMISASVLDGFVRQSVDLVNIERHKLGLPALVCDSAIEDVARAHAGDMAKSNTYSHTGTDGSTPAERLRNAGFDDFYQLEIIARAFPNAVTAFSALLNNEQYRAVLRANYTSIGTGAAYNPQSDGILYYTQVFYSAK